MVNKLDAIKIYEIAESGNTDRTLPERLRLCARQYVYAIAYTDAV